MKQLILFCCLPFCAAGQYSSGVLSPTVYSVLAYSNQAPALSLTGNQASMARAEKFTAGIYGERPYMLPELSTYSAAFVFPTKMGVFGGNLAYSGAAPHTSHSLGFGYARKLGKTFIGVQFHWMGTQIQGYEKSSNIAADLAMQYKVSEQFIVGFQIGNASGFNKGKEYSNQTIYRMGGGYQISEQCYLGVEYVSRAEQSSYLQTALQYNFLDIFYAWVGYVSGNGSAMGGAGVQKGKIRLDINVSHHPYLGLTPGIGISKPL